MKIGRKQCRGCIFSTTAFVSRLNGFYRKDRERERENEEGERVTDSQIESENLARIREKEEKGNGRFKEIVNRVNFFRLTPSPRERDAQKVFALKARRMAACLLRSSLYEIEQGTTGGESDWRASSRDGEVRSERKQARREPRLRSIKRRKLEF